jgi:hypothetical protein
VDSLKDIRVFRFFALSALRDLLPLKEISRARRKGLSEIRYQTVSGDVLDGRQVKRAPFFELVFARLFFARAVCHARSLHAIPYLFACLEVFLCALYGGGCLVELL